MQQFMDHVGRHVEVPLSPKRIISLCPAITSTLFEIGLQDEIVGRTRFCIFPKEQVINIPIVGGTKEMNIEEIRKLKPDLILAEKEENTKEMVALLEKEFTVFVFEVQSIEENTRMIQDLGKLVQQEKNANELLQKIELAFAHLPNLQGKKAAYMIWRTPYMVVGNQTYINSVLERLNLENPFKEFEGRYPVITLDELRNAGLDYLFLATEPFRFQEKHVEEFSALLPNIQVSLIDGEMFWYGSNMVDGGEYLVNKFKL